MDIAKYMGNLGAKEINALAEYSELQKKIESDPYSQLKRTIEHDPYSQVKRAIENDHYSQVKRAMEGDPYSQLQRSLGTCSVDATHKYLSDAAVVGRTLQGTSELAKLTAVPSSFLAEANFAAVSASALAEVSFAKRPSSDFTGANMTTAPASVLAEAMGATLATAPTSVLASAAGATWASDENSIAAMHQASLSAMGKFKIDDLQMYLLKEYKATPFVGQVAANHQQSAIAHAWPTYVTPHGNSFADLAQKYKDAAAGPDFTRQLQAAVSISDLKQEYMADFGKYYRNQVGMLHGPIDAVGSNASLSLRTASLHDALVKLNTPLTTLGLIAAYGDAADAYRDTLSGITANQLASLLPSARLFAQDATLRLLEVDIHASALYELENEGNGLSAEEIKEAPDDVLNRLSEIRHKDRQGILRKLEISEAAAERNKREAKELKTEMGLLQKKIDELTKMANQTQKQIDGTRSANLLYSEAIRASWVVSAKNLWKALPRPLSYMWGKKPNFAELGKAVAKQMEFIGTPHKTIANELRLDKNKASFFLD